MVESKGFGIFTLTVSIYMIVASIIYWIRRKKNPIKVSFSGIRGFVVFRCLA